MLESQLFRDIGWQKATSVEHLMKIKLTIHCSMLRNPLLNLPFSNKYVIVIITITLIFIFIVVVEGVTVILMIKNIMNINK